MTEIADVNTNASRDAEIVQHRTQGKTLEEIGKLYGLTRERVRQIIDAHGGPTATASRERRHSIAAKKAKEDVDFLVRELSEAIHRVAARGESIGSIRTMVKTLYFDYDPKLLEKALEEICPIVDRNISETRFTDEEIRFGYLLIHGKVRNLEGCRVDVLDCLESSSLEKLVDTLQNQGLNEERILDSLCTIAAAMQNIRSQRTKSISKKEYDAAREQLLKEVGIVSAQGLSPWPPTSQTLMKRIGDGYWKGIAHSLGLIPQEKGRSRGGLLYTDDEYMAALSKFLQESEKFGGGTTFNDYEGWVSTKEALGERFPGAQAVRLKYGKWSWALREASNHTGIRGAFTRPTGPRLTSLQPRQACRSKVEEGFQDLEPIAILERDARIKRLIQEVTRDFEVAYRAWFRSMVSCNQNLAHSLKLHTHTQVGLARKKHAAIVTDLDALNLLSDKKIDEFLRDIGPASYDGWFSDEANVELATIPMEVQIKYQLLRELRNLSTHISSGSLNRMINAWNEVSKLDAAFGKNKTSARQIMDGLMANDMRALKSLMDAMLLIWDYLQLAEVAALEANNSV